MRTLTLSVAIIAAVSSTAFAGQSNTTNPQVAWAAAAMKCLQSHDSTKSCGIVDNGKGGPTMWCPSKVDVNNAIRAVCDKQADAAGHPPQWKQR